MIKEFIAKFNCRVLKKHKFVHIFTNIFKHKIYLYYKCEACGITTTKKYS